MRRSITATSPFLEDLAALFFALLPFALSAGADLSWHEASVLAALEEHEGAALPDFWQQAGCDWAYTPVANRAKTARNKFFMEILIRVKRSCVGICAKAQLHLSKLQKIGQIQDVSLGK